VSRVELDLSDIQMAVEHKMKHRKEFTQRPDQAMLKELAESKNKIDLPQIPRHKTMPLPTAKNCLTAENFQVLLPRARMPAAHTHTADPLRSRVFVCVCVCLCVCFHTLLCRRLSDKVYPSLAVARGSRPELFTTLFTTLGGSGKREDAGQRAALN
jgi:hypothetical protein